MFNKLLKFPLKEANHIAGAFLQLCIVYTCGFGIFNEYYNLVDQEHLNVNLKSIFYIFSGYFIYDTVFILFSDGVTWFVGHHLISLLIVHYGYKNQFSETWYHNIYAFCVELANPCLHIRHVTIHYPTLHKINMFLIFLLYTSARVIMGPITSYYYLTYVSLTPDLYLILSITSASVVVMSLFWYPKIVNMVFRKDKNKQL